MDSSDSEDSSSEMQPPVELICECEEMHLMHDEDDEEEMASFTRDPEDVCWVEESRLGVSINCANKDLVTVAITEDDIRTLCHEHLDAINRHLCCWYCLKLVVTGTFLECPSGHRMDPLCNALKRKMEEGEERACSHCGSTILSERQIQLQLEDADESQVTAFTKLIVEVERANKEGLIQSRSVVDQWKQRMRALAPQVLVAFRHSPQRVSDLAVRMIRMRHLIEFEQLDLMKKLVDERGISPNGRTLHVSSDAVTITCPEGELPFEYTDVVSDPDELTEITTEKAIMFCGCEGVCVPETCACCTREYSIDKTTNETIIGSIRPSMTAVSECGPACACPTTCGNRLVQSGGKPYQLETFSTGDRGVGVRAKERIPKGRFIIEYTGAVRTMDDGDVTNNYCFETVLGLQRVEIDASRSGNAARYINHSCNPNAVIVRVAWEPVEKRRLFHLAIFALEDIDDGREITIDYGDAFWIAKIDEYACMCGSDGCRHHEEIRQQRLREAEMDDEEESESDEDDEDEDGSDEEDEEVLEELVGEGDREGGRMMEEEDDVEELNFGEDAGVVEEYVEDEGVEEHNEDGDVEVEELNFDEVVDEDEDEDVDVVEVSERDEEESEINVIDV